MSQDGFSDHENEILSYYISNVNSNVFVLKNLPEVVKGALFSRYSRSKKSLKELLLNDFISGDQSVDDNSLSNVKKAQEFYNRILDGYGDDSIGELGGAHIAVEKVSMLAAKALEDRRIGGSPLEKSTRYIRFDEKINNEYQFYREPILMTSAFRNLYLDTCNMLFDTYKDLIPEVEKIIKKTFIYSDSYSERAYQAALNAKVYDCLRGLLPSGTLTNLGIFGNGRFFEYMIKRLNTANLQELKNIGESVFNELDKVIPSFVRRAHFEHQNQQDYVKFIDNMESDLKVKSSINANKDFKEEPYVKMISFDKDSIKKLASALVFPNCDYSLDDLNDFFDDSKRDLIESIFDAASQYRENRRHKSPRALENISFTFEIVADFGCYRDLQRHRLNTQERQLLTCDLGYYVPEEIKDSDVEKIYVEALKSAKDAYDKMKLEFAEESQYIVPMAYNIRWYFTVNLRSLQWMCELRSQKAGHENYRLIAQKMVKQILDKFPSFSKFFGFVDFSKVSLGRIDSEQKNVERNINE